MTDASHLPVVHSPSHDSAAPSTPPWRLLLLIMVLDALIVLPFLGRVTLCNNDEGRFAQIGCEMAETGDWLIPRIGGRTFSSYPPLAYWCVGASGSAFGWTEWAARLPGALAGVALVGLAGLFAWRFTGSRAAAACAAVALATTPGFNAQQATCRADTILVLLVGAAVYLFYAIALEERPSHLTGAAGDRSGGRRPVRGERLRVAAFWYLLGLSVLAKGPLGVVLTGLAVGPWIAWRRRWDMIGRLHPEYGLPALALMTLPWYVHFASVAGKGAIEYNLFFENVDNFTKGGQHPQPLYFYLLKMPGRALPWLLALAALPALPAARRGASAPGIWFLATLAFLTASSGKRINYVTYMYTPLALLEGIALASLLAEPKAWRGLARAAAALAALGAAFAASIPAVPGLWQRADLVRLNPGACAAAGAVGSLAFGAAALLFALKRGLAATGCAGVAVAGALVLYAAVLYPSGDGEGRAEAAFCRSFAESVPEGERIGVLGAEPKAHYYYYGPRRMLFLGEPAALTAAGLRYGLSQETFRPAAATVLREYREPDQPIVWTLWRLP